MVDRRHVRQVLMGKAAARPLLHLLLAKLVTVAAFGVMGTSFAGVSILSPSIDTSSRGCCQATRLEWSTSESPAPEAVQRTPLTELRPGQKLVGLVTGVT
eukprot:1211137-Amphidinium_carterae.1